MVNRNDPNYDKDKVYCPISLEIMQHPIQIFPSGKYYELASILKSIGSPLGLVCPTTRLPIEKFRYDQELKKLLDTEYQHAPDRFQPYDHILLINDLEQLLDVEQQHQKNKKNLFLAHLNIDFGLSISLSGISWAALQLLSNHDIIDLNDGASFLFAAAAGLIDYSLRKITNSEFGLFSVPIRTIQSAHQLFTLDMDAQREEMLNLRV